MHACFKLAKCDNAENVKSLLTGKVWKMRPVRVMWAWIWVKWVIEVHDSSVNNTGFVIIRLVFEVGVDSVENRQRSLTLTTFML